MQPRSAAFDLAVTAGGNVVQSVNVQRIQPGGSPVTLLTGLQPMPGSVIQIDRRAPIRRTIKLVLGATSGSLVPKLATDPLAPYGNELVVRMGFRYASGVTETVPVGVFRIEDVSSDTDGKITISGRDRGSVIEQAKFELPYVLPVSTNLGTALRALVASRFPGTLSYAFSPTTVLTPATAIVYLEGDTSGNPWQNAIDLATAAGFELFFDAAGAIVFQPIPNPVATSAVWTYSPGPAALMLSAQDDLTSKDVFNVIVIAGEGGPLGVPGGAVNPIRSTTEVTDASSPIFPSGAFGRRPFFVNDPTIITQAQADAVAASLLLRYAGSGEVIGFTAAPHPALEGGDVARLTEPTTLGLDTYVVLDSWDLDLGLQKEQSFATTGRRSL